MIIALCNGYNGDDKPACDAHRGLRIINEINRGAEPLTNATAIGVHLAACREHCLVDRGSLPLPAY